MKPFNEHLKNYLAMLLGRTSRAITNLLQKKFHEAGYPLSVEQWLLLINLRNCNNQTHQQLAENTFKDKTTVTRLVERLEKQRLIERTPDRHDRRQKNIRITSRGRNLLRELKPLAFEVQKTALIDIEPDELHHCMKTMFKIYGNVSER